MYEFAITNGVGRLIDYGVCSMTELRTMMDAQLGWNDVTFITRYCSKNCETGQ